MAKQPLQQQNKTMKVGFIALAFLHLLCCGIPLLLLAGVSFTFVWPTWPVIGGVLMVLGIVGFIWYMKRGCATCPRNEGRNCSLKRHPGMTCAACPITVKKALSKVDGVSKTEVSYEKREAVVTFDNAKTSAQKLTKATEDAGYPSSVKR